MFLRKADTAPDAESNPDQGESAQHVEPDIRELSRRERECCDVKREERRQYDPPVDGDSPVLLDCKVDDLAGHRVRVLIGVRESLHRGVCR